MQTHLFEITLEVRSHTFLPVLLLEVHKPGPKERLISSGLA